MNIQIQIDAQRSSAYHLGSAFGLSEIYRYLLNSTADDETGEASFFTYDQTVKLIIQKDCELILNPLKLASGLPQPLGCYFQEIYFLRWPH